MTILNDLISMLDMDAHVEDIRQGVFHTGVLTRNCGLAATLPKDALKQEPPLVREPGALVRKSPFELVQMAHSESILEASIGMAAINSLLDAEAEDCLELNARDLITERGQGKRIAIVGHFPFIPALRKISKELWVIEKNPKKGDFSESEAGNLIPRADIVAITGTAFTNHTLESLLSLCGADAFVIVLGDTTPLAPLLFDYGIDALSGTMVTDPELALRCVSEGANFRQIKGVRRLTITK
ncbi:Rossmann-like domain-containing protein [Thermodesulfobacteriota bacterium]